MAARETAKPTRSGKLPASGGKLPESAGELPASAAALAAAPAKATAASAKVTAGAVEGVSGVGRGSMRDELRALLALPPEALEIRTEQTAILAALLGKARGGDVSAASFIRDTIGEKPVERKERPDGKPAGEIIVKWRD